ncbi:MAG: ATP-binding cassette domain-containing protein [Fluviicola sp.]
MTTFQSKINQTRNHFKNSDIDLGFRNLVDCVLDTADKTYYQKTIDLVSWKEQNPEDSDQFVQRSLSLLQELEQLTIAVKNEHEALAVIADLTKKYRRSSFEIGPINISIHSGEIWGLVGENGNGKTSLLRVIAKDLEFDKGTILFSPDLEQLHLYNQRSHLAYIPQRTPKWHGSLKSNLKFTASQYGILGEENELLVLMYIIRFGLWSFRNYKWNELSSGYKMRFELARTFLRKPKLLLLDEPLANLDVLAQQLILEDLKLMAASLSNPLGIILSSQQLFEVEKVADKVIFLKKGSPVYIDHSKEVQEGALDEADHVSQKTSAAEQKTILEMDIQLSKEELSAIIQSLPVDQIQFNGGIFIVHISKQACMNEVLQKLIDSKVRITYIRDISKSSRRFFIQNT